MANEQNLIPQESRTIEERRRIASLGGKARARNIQRRKTLKEELLLLLETDEFQKRISTSLLKEAEKGNVRAFEVIRDTIGEKEPETVNIGKNSPADELLKSIDELKNKE